MVPAASRLILLCPYTSKEDLSLISLFGHKQTRKCISEKEKRQVLSSILKDLAVCLEGQQTLQLTKDMSVLLSVPWFLVTQALWELLHCSRHVI